MKLLYKPIGIILGLLAGLVGKKVFNVVWGVFDDEEPPKPTTERANWPKILAAAAVQGMVFRLIRAVVDRNAAQAWRFVTGVWPGEQEQEASQAARLVR